MPMMGELYVYNHDGTQLEGPRDNKSSRIFAYSHEVYLPYDRDELKIVGSRKLTAFSVTKEIDKLTPQLYEIVCRGRNCKKVIIKLYRINKTGGGEEEYFIYTLEDAKVVQVENRMPSMKIAENEDTGHVEKLEFIARTITWQYLEGGVEYTEKTF